MTHFETIVRGGNVVTPDGLASADVAIVNGTIVAVGPEHRGRCEADDRRARAGTSCQEPSTSTSTSTTPGRDEWEGWPTGSLAAATGGTTTVVDMPLNANPPTLDGLSFDAKLRAAESSSFVDFAFWGGSTPNNLGSMEELAERGVVGFKAFMCDSGIEDFPAADDGTLFEGHATRRGARAPVAVHAENEALTRSLAARARAGGMNDAHAPMPPRGRRSRRSRRFHEHFFSPKQRAARSTSSTSAQPRGAALVAAARARGIDVTAETCPHYLWFAEEDLDELGALAKCAPPLRGRSEVLRLRKAVARGDLQIVASDHSPCPEPMKHDADFFQIWGGIAGCQTLLMAMLYGQ